MLEKFGSFDQMITPTIIKIIFWIGVGFSALFAIIIFFGAFTAEGNVLNIFVGLITIVVGPLVVRIYCELLILGFKIAESLSSLNDKVDQLNEKLSE
ncbi:MAG TPA: DUF4282 domain-containing protein [Bacillota bacterium]|nr:DUF4282 domain-containing protein [Bacillota bacterium]